VSYKNVRLSLILAIVASLTVLDTAFASFTSGPYFPIRSGNFWTYHFWTYQVDLGVRFTTTVEPGTTYINGVHTKALRDSWPAQTTNYFTNDSNGIRLHRQYHSGFDFLVTYSPPITFVNAVTDLGHTVNSSGTAATNFANFSYTASFTTQAFENISVFAGDYTALRVHGTVTLCSGSICEGSTHTFYFAANVGIIKEIGNSSATGAYTNELVVTNVQTPLVAALLPTSRSVQVGRAATAFATIVNGGTTTATSCRIAPITAIPAWFAYQTTDPATNQVTGSLNTPADIVAGGFQSYILSFVPTASFAPTDVELGFACTNVGPATIHTGLNTLLLSASATPVPDIVALAATFSGDGIVSISGPTGTGVFAVATVNVGASGSITASADTGSAILPVHISLCQTNPATGLCISALGPSVTTQINVGATPTFGIFVQGSGNVPFDPATHRVFVRFKDGGVTRGSTSVAVRTQ
jgi:hypothetical protein